jgi:hypothetical protein
MESAAPECPACGAALPVSGRRPGDLLPCPGCAAPTDLRLFPALVRAPANTTPAAPSLPGDATCFHHPDRVAVVACGRCGRFLCGLCDLDLGDRHVCAACLHAEHEGGGPDGRRVSRLLQYDSLSLALAVVPILTVAFWFMSCLTAPAAVFLVFRFWRRPMSLLPRTRVRFVLALLLATATLVGWVAIIYLIAAESLTATATVQGGLPAGTAPN